VYTTGIYQESCYSKNHYSDRLITSIYLIYTKSPAILTLDYWYILLVYTRGIARNLFRRGTKPEDWGQKSPSGVQGQSPGGGLGAKPPEAEDIYANNHCNVLTKTSEFFSAWEFLGGGMSSLSPLPYAPGIYQKSCYPEDCYSEDRYYFG